MSVKRFVTRRVEIEAMQFTGDNFNGMTEWTEGNFRNASGPYVAPDGSTLDITIIRGEVYDFLHETWIKVRPGQWIVQGAKGEFYPCDDETFHWKYEEIEARQQRHEELYRALDEKMRNITWEDK